MTKTPGTKRVLRPSELAPRAALAVLDRLIWNQLIVHAVLDSLEQDCLTQLIARVNAAVYARGFTGLDAEFHKHAVLAALEILMNPEGKLASFECKRPIYHILNTLADRYECDFDWVANTALIEQMRMLDAPPAALIGLCERGLVSEYHRAPLDYLRSIVTWGVVTSNKQVPRDDPSSTDVALLRVGLLIDFEAHGPTRDARTSARPDFALYPPQQDDDVAPADDDQRNPTKPYTTPETTVRLRGYSWPSKCAVERMAAGHFDPDFLTRVQWDRDFDRIAFPCRLGRALPSPDSGEILQYFMRLGWAWAQTPPEPGTFAGWPTSVGAAMVAVEVARQPHRAVFSTYGNERTITGDVSRELAQVGITVLPRSLNNRYNKMKDGLLQVVKEHHAKNQVACKQIWGNDDRYRDNIRGFNARLHWRGLTN